MEKAKSDRNVVAEILRFNEGRKPWLLRIKWEKLALDPFSFFRGTDHLLARDWSDLAPADAGPRLLSCGDLHVENFGAYLAEEGDYLFDINDFDEALSAPCTVDLVRACASIHLARETWKLSPESAQEDVGAFLDQYRRAVRESARSGEAGRFSIGSESGAVGDLLGATALANRVELLDRLTTLTPKGHHRLIDRIDGKFFSIRPNRFERVTDAVEGLGKRLGRPEAYSVRDVVGRIAGVGSLGLRRYVALLNGDGTRDGCWLLDVKEARPSCLLPLSAGPQPELGPDEAVRTAQAQRLLQASSATGLETLSMDDRSYRVRRMVPEENRSSLDHLHHKKKGLGEAIGTLGRIVGWSHYRGAAFLGPKNVEALAAWVEADIVTPLSESARRYAEIARYDYESFHHALEHGGIASTRA